MEDEQRRGRGGITIPKWVASIIVAALLGWSGSWIGYTVHSGAAVETRVTVLESRVERADEDRREILERVKSIDDMVQWLATQVAYSGATISSPPPRRTADRLNPPAPPVHVSRNAAEVQCGANETKLRAANGEWFCRPAR